MITAREVAREVQEKNATEADKNRAHQAAEAEKARQWQNERDRKQDEKDEKNRQWQEAQEKDRRAWQESQESKRTAQDYSYKKRLAVITAVTTVLLAGIASVVAFFGGRYFAEIDKHKQTPNTQAAPQSSSMP
ncbi:hypothetical protein GobsT_37370 [Gemmata obscuriglobus]|uniref:Uncharacterized protein n=2 Tax=Gemmata obscuriglobus TaxID=114 RepID=A0A2Z3GZY8_9BACT|nr:hypothetical protein C1280_14975 [Gemmata obscuriglobus]VTS01394.1 unnamed protein product [Gemmata obscuriglobus UQM 2246]AWM40398.1 hypothetical protein C1280_27705 [Gemmata obscuriglobus]QEG26368.1 hypothetical protein GobsT_11070 [Gemmata obscuriglobus]QEG28948.1 hypothetical protein GobsT_37370 [Gemmata obscuriglobus]